MDGWSEPDARGVRTQTLDVGARVTLRGRRKRRNFTRDTSIAAIWPGEWRALARDWFGGADTLRWPTLLRRAGPARVATARELLDALLWAGWIELSERRESGGLWVPVHISILDLEPCREALGLSNRDRVSADWAEARGRILGQAELAEAVLHLDGLAPTFALRRHRWLSALDRWCAEQRSGTRRDFAYFASGLTKGIPDADWNWLAEAVDLNALGVDPHTPLLLIRGPLRLMLRAGRLDLDATPDFHGLTPATLAACETAEGAFERYRLIENRTTFEHACRAANPHEAVIWVPGRPPRWWRDVMSQLLSLLPAPAVIEADPDPAGMAIACEAGEVWTRLALSWSTHNMEPTVLDRLPRTQALSETDRRELERLLGAGLPPCLQELALVMQQRGIKGEQEGLRIGHRSRSALPDPS